VPLKGAEIWFVDNEQAPPDILFRDLEGAAVKPPTSERKTPEAPTMSPYLVTLSRAGAPASGIKVKPPGDPASRAVAAAYALRKKGEPISVRAVCAAAKVDRKNLAANHPEIIELIETLAQPDRKPPSGQHDRRTATFEALDDSKDD
jgi:hypothetical protein